MIKVAFLVLFAVAAANASCSRNGNVPSNKCATLFDDKDCDGWALDVSTGYTELPYSKKNDAEAVVVKAGCKLIGYDHKSSNVGQRGSSVTIDATHSSSNLDKNLRGNGELEEKISSVECQCGSSSGRPPAGNSNSGGSGSYNPGQEINNDSARPGNARGQCPYVTFSDSTSCIVYDDEDCVLDDWNSPINMRNGDRKSLTSRSQKNQIESVSVKRGCSLKVWTEANYRGSQYIFTAPSSQDRHDTFDNDSGMRFLKDNVQSMQCSC